MNAGRLIAQLEEIDPAAPMFINICGHRHEIYGIEAQVGYAEVILYDESAPECNIPQVPERDGHQPGWRG